MKIRHWDEARQTWVIDGASNASNLELTNPSYIDNLGNSVSVDQGFTKIANKLNKLESNLAWVYLNGALGGGSGGGTGGGETYTITITEGATIYTSTSSADINVTIQSGTVKKAFTLVVKNLSTNTIISTTKIYSLTRTKIALTGLKGTTDIELTAYDSNNNYTVPTYIKAVAGAISLGIQSVPNNTLYIGGTADVLANYVISNNIAGAAAGFTLTINGVEVVKEIGITTAVKSLSYNIRTLLFNSGFFTPVSGQKFVFIAKAFTILNNETLTSNIISFNITVADSQKLVIITNGISDFIPSGNVNQTYNDLTAVEQNSRVTFPYYLSYGLTKYNSFVLEYNIIKVTSTGETPMLETPVTVENILPNDINRSLSLTISSLEINLSGEYYRIDLFAYAKSGIGDLDAQDTAFVTFVITESSEVILTANNDIETLLAYYSPITGFPNQATGTWTYTHSNTGKFAYSDSMKSKFPTGVKLTLKDVNGVKSGFLAESARSREVPNKVPGIVLSGESYGYIEVANQMFPNVIIDSGLSFFRSLGFNISFTYKALESSNPDEVIVSLGRYVDDVLDSGFEISLDKIYIKIGQADAILCKLPQNQLLTVDLDVSLIDNGWYFKVFINGVLSGVTRVLQQDIDWQFTKDLYLGCRNNNGVCSRFSDVTFYDIKLYTSSQSDFAIVQNYISATEQANLIDGRIDQNLDIELRTKNFFDSAGKCIIWDESLEVAGRKKGGFLTGQVLYQTLISRIDNVYPIVLIEETSESPTLFKAYSTAIFSAGEKESVMGTTFPVKITYTDVTGTVNIQTPAGVSSTNGVRVGLQGTSSLSYTSKNYELYIGDKNSAGDALLFQPKDEWLPENEFTLKADVIDSSHVNNVVIGKIINGEIKNTQGIPIKPLGATPPMALGNDVWDGDSVKAENIRGKIKHTSDGFPCLLFIRYAPDANGNIKEPEFKGIYNFNLGRYAFYNLGLKILKDYTKDIESGPTTVTQYTEADNIWSTSEDNGVYSVEINQNTSSQGAFQQDALPIVKFMGDVAYSSRDTEVAYTKVKKFYTQMANMALIKTPKYTMDDSGQTPRKLVDLGVNAEAWNSSISYALGDYAYNESFYTFKSLVPNNTTPIPTSNMSSAEWEYFGEIRTFYNARDTGGYYNFSMTDKALNWENACGYFVIGLIFGMVDSMCKNLTLRNWEQDTWYTTFYDMDTAFGLNNAGQDIVEYWAHLHRWRNINRLDTNLTSYEQIKNYQSDVNFRQYYASWWNRIWEVLENLALIDSGAVGNRESIASIYVKLRQNLFPDPEKFIDTYYKGYTEKTGSIIFNYDYNIKYLTIAQTYDSITDTYIDSTSFDQLKFLHGNRVMHVRDWFKKRIYFLDSIYGVSKDTVSIPITIESPVNSVWLSNKVTGSTSGNKFVAKMAANSRILYRYSFDKTTGGFWLDTTSQDVIVPVPSGETIGYIYANDYITRFDSFKSYPWTGLNNINLPLLEELDLSYLTNMPATDFFSGGVYDKINKIGLKNIRKLNLSNVILTGGNASAYTLDVSGCSKLQELDISYSSITKVTLSDDAALKVYNLAGTAITSLVLKNQSFLTSLILTDCNKLTSIEIENCNNLSVIDLSPSVESVKITNCSLLRSISLPYYSATNAISLLRLISIDNCPELKIFDINGQNNPALKIELVGAPNLEVLNLESTATTDLLLPSLFVGGLPYFNSLKSINISRTNYSAFKYNDNQNLTYLDLSHFPNLDSLIASDTKQLVKVVCTNDPNNPVNLDSGSFRNCSALTTIEGHFNILGSEVFKGCSNLVLNSESVYASNGTDFITGPNAANITFDNSVTSLFSCFEGCTKLNGGDFNYLIIRLTSVLTSIEAMFRGCSGINAPITRDLFLHSPNLLTIKEAFSGCKLTGILYSRSLNYNPADNQTWGLLDFVPKLQDAEGAFENTLLQWIDNRFFEPVTINGVTTPLTLIRIDRMFRRCTALKTCTDTTQTPDENGNLIDGFLESETFFTNLKNILAFYPKEVFSGCVNVKMNITNDGVNSFLFHTSKDTSERVILDNTLYSGIQLFGDIKVNVFGGISRTITKGTNTYYIPIITSIQSPFSAVSGGNITVRLSEMGQIFRNINSTLLQAIGIFQGLKINPEDTGVIPPDIFQGCSVLNSIESLFSGLDLTNNNQIYTFPATYVDGGITKGMFDDCISLRTTKNLFSYCTKLKIQLVGEGFKNCRLEDVSGMFKGSALFGTIPYRLFFMEQVINGVRVLRRTITNMIGVFGNCWNLGYDQTREIDTSTIIGLGTPVSWDQHIVKTEGNPVSFRLNVSDLKKSFNYNRDEREYIAYAPTYSSFTKYIFTTVYEVYDVSNIVFYKKVVISGIDTYTVTTYNGYSEEEVYTESGGVYTLYTVPNLFVKNPTYNPGETAFDSWYLDGYGWEGATSNETGLSDVKTRLFDHYFTYDIQQKDVVASQKALGRYQTCYQNYMIPTDLFRYCHSTATLNGVLRDLNWPKHILKENLSTGIKEIAVASSVNPVTGINEPIIEGLKGRIPMRLFEDLKTSTKFDGVFQDTRFDAFVGLNSNTLVRGIMFPPDLLEYNIALLEIPDLFNNIKIPVGVDVNSNIFFSLGNVNNVSQVFANCQFNRQMHALSIDEADNIYPQINFMTLFKYNQRIVNASALFATYLYTKDYPRGLYFIDASLFPAQYNLNNISNMFYDNKNMKGSIPLFKAIMYPILSNVAGYLYGVPKANITNAAEVELRLRPTEWLT